MNERLVVLLGAGGHGSVVLDALLDSDIKVFGIIDPGLPVGQTVFDVPVLGGDEWLDQVEPGSVFLVNGIGEYPFSNTRSRFFGTWKARGHSFLSVFHPHAFVGRNTMFCEGCQIMAGSIVQCRATVSENVVINTRASVDHDCYIGPHTFIGPGAILCGGVHVGDNAFIGAGAIVLPGIAIGNNATIASGALVTRDVCCDGFVVGSPATLRDRVG